jgi:hypothetical protein
VLISSCILVSSKKVFRDEEQTLSVVKLIATSVEQLVLSFEAQEVVCGFIVPEAFLLGGRRSHTRG